MSRAIAKAQAALDRAAEQMAQARKEHRAQFLTALSALYERYGLSVHYAQKDPADVGAHLIIVERDCIEFGELPE